MPRLNEPTPSNQAKGTDPSDLAMHKGATTGSTETTTEKGYNPADLYQPAWFTSTSSEISPASYSEIA